MSPARRRMSSSMWDKFLCMGLTLEITVLISDIYALWLRVSHSIILLEVKMPVLRGRLKPADYAKIKNNLSYIKENVDALDIVDLLFERNIFEEGDVQEIKAFARRDDRTTRMCYMLLRSGPGNAYETFLDILRTDHPHVAEKLESTDSSSAQFDAINSWAWFDALPDSYKNIMIDDRVASLISSCIGEGWDHVFLRLGLKKIAISQERSRHPRSDSLAVTALIIRWRQKVASQATLGAMVSVLRQVEGECEVDIDALEQAIKPSGALETAI